MDVQDRTTVELQRSATMKAQKKMLERRRFERATVLWSGHLAFGDQVIACLIVNISSNGAMVRTDEAGVCATTVTLRNSRIGELAAEVRWRKHDELGLKFLDEHILRGSGPDRHAETRPDGRDDEPARPRLMRIPGCRSH
jgi:hypothetical protein